MKTVLLSSATVLFLATSCQPSDDQKSIEKMQDQVMVVHDEVMPRTGELMDLKEKISLRIDSLSKITPSSEATQTRQQQGIAINQALTAADSVMYDWMNNYNADTLRGMDETQAKSYLDEELKKITVIKTQINDGINQAKKFLAN
ncbi:hypothetical protein [Larkinella harenae]